MSTHVRSAARLEAFSDGVIAVILTIMVLELHVPHEDGLRGLIAISPRIGLYVLSFLNVGIYWINHHELCARASTVTYRLLWSNLGWLFSLSIIPFFTDYVGEKHFDSFSTALYGGVMLLTGLMYGVLRMAVIAVQKIDGSFAEADREQVRKHVASALMYVVSIPLSYYRPIFALLLNFAVTLVWIIPELGTRHCKPDQFPESYSR